ncbi:HAD family hydrolase [Vallitalea okinawensis]|uniref:HAD family hydrolase n=1 Tax=Vallitalea okinawensis TaxID=2078660 RepID=UPI000CFAB1A0|nr:HAD family hydrolase [Vallitalea okinawensis]
MNEKQLVIFIDSGDTLIDETSEVYVEGELVKEAEFIPGAVETIKTLKTRGYKIIMVADGLRQSFINVHKHQHDMYDYYDGHIYSEDIGVYKPDAKMFKAALEAADLTEDDVHRVVMVGNNIERDIKGANDMNMTSIHIDWSKRYRQEPKDDSEIPDYFIENPIELIDLVEKLNSQLEA